MPSDRFGSPFFYPSKPSGFFYEQSDNPKNDTPLEGLNSDFSVSGAIITMHCNGPTSFSVGKNGRGFNDSIGGCNMDFKATAKRGYAYKQDDVRDVEFKCWLRVPSNLSSGHDGFSMSACTGRHTGSSCCQGFAYMGSLDGINSNPTKYRFRKETVHVQYTDAPETIPSKSHPKMNFKISGHDWVGFGFCRYNKPTSGGTSPQDDSVILEIWFNPDPTNDPKDWTMLHRIEDKKGKGWTGSKGKCNGDNDQIGVWSGAHNRLKSNSTSGTIQFTSISFREIDPFGTFEEPPPPPVTCPTGQHPDANGNCVLDTPGGGTGGGGSGGGGTPPPVSYTYEYKFGTQGSGNGQFLNPHDISFDAAGNVFVCDRDRNDVQKFTHAGVYISKFGSTGSGNGQFNVPYAIQHDPTFAFIYVCDRDNNRVQKLNATTGAWISSITTAGGKNIAGPEDIIFDPSGNMYICDTDNERIVKFNSSHTFLLEWGSKGSGNGQFDHPHSSDVGLDGNIYISSGNQGYIQVFSPTGTFLRKFSKPGTADGELLTFLEHLDIDYKGRLHIINNNVRPIVSVFDCATGNFLTKYGSPEREGSANGQFREPEHVTVYTDGKPFVVDCKNFRIQVFSVNEPPPPDPGGGGSGGPPAEPSKVVGIFTLKSDINVYRTDACEGTTGGGGSGGSAIFFGPVDPNFDKQLADVSAWTFRTRIAVLLKGSGSAMLNKVLKQFDVPIKKVGSPAATPTISAVIWNKYSHVMYTSPTLIDPTTLTTSFTTQTFDFSANTYHFVLGDMVGIKYFADSSTSNVNYVVAGYDMIGVGNTTELQLESGVWREHLDRDLACTMWE